MSAWLVLPVYVLVHVLDFVIVLFQREVFQHIIFFVRVVVATRVCCGCCCRLRYRVISEWCFGTRIGLQSLGEVALCAYLQNVILYSEKTTSAAENELARGV